ncbi:MAG: tetratricopeptide repeat protein, partial [Verrucomicrobiota bacterium]
LENSVVKGVVSAKRDFDGFEMIQLAIPIEPGNSGGPLLDMQGRVHGLLTMKSMMSANLGFAMPINLLKPLLEKPNPVPMNRWLTIGALNPKEWTPLMGARWSQKVGRVHVEGLGKGFGGRSLCLAQKEVDARPYEIAVSVRLEDESGAAGLIFASDGDQKHYGFYPTGGQLRLTRFDGPDVYSWAILQTVPSAQYRPGDWNYLKVSVDKEKIRCYLNNELVIESSDDKLAGGKVGLAKFRDTKADFKNFQVGANLVSPNAPISAELVTSITKAIQNLSDKSDLQILDVLKSNAEASRGILSERAIGLEREAAQLRKLAVAVHRQSVQQELVKTFEMPEEQIDLFRAALLLAKLDNPDLEIEAYQSQLESMAHELSAKLPENADNSIRLDALTKYLFAENGFHGSRSDYYNRANSYMNQVLDDREGLPITLSVLFIELAKRIGLENVFGVALPGHFIAKCASEAREDQLIDVFDGGSRLTRAQANDIVMAYTGARLREDQLKAATKREIIVRMLRNLLAVAQDTESAANVLRYQDLIVALSPDSPADRLDRARLRLQSGDSIGAKQDFKWLLDNEPPGIDLERITEIYRAL